MRVCRKRCPESYRCSWTLYWELQRVLWN